MQWWGWGAHYGISALVSRWRDQSFPAPPREAIVRRQPSANQEGGPTGNWVGWHLHLGVPSLQSCEREINACCLRHQIVVVCYSSLSWLRRNVRLLHCFRVYVTFHVQDTGLQVRELQARGLTLHRFSSLSATILQKCWAGYFLSNTYLLHLMLY